MSAADLAQKRSHSTVLVADDEVLIRQAIACHLRDLGWRVLEARNGEEAQALFIAGGPIDVVFSDVQMSAELDGVSLARWVHEHHPTVHVILTSGLAAVVPAEVCAEASIFRKPYELDAVAAHIQTLLG